ncbi:MAG: hypothetical protein KDB00_20540 [Planctomycetales bacterium]|nr:hypothetical protein [Planctomycetales bacterium]
MAIKTVQVFARGGRELIDLLSHCVLSVNTDALFLYLVREYQLHPQATRAIALYDVFCGAQAPARISDTSLIAPRDVRLQNNINEIRAAIVAVEAFRESQQPDVLSEEPNPESPEETDRRPPTIPLPPHYLFDPVANQLAGVSGKLVHLETHYDPTLSPLENLPGGELNAGQRAFVENVWTPRVRPYLVSAGFWRIATVG